MSQYRYPAEQHSRVVHICTHRIPSADGLHAAPAAAPAAAVATAAPATPATVAAPPAAKATGARCTKRLHVHLRGAETELVSCLLMS